MDNYKNEDWINFKQEINTSKQVYNHGRLHSEMKNQ